MKNWFLEIIFTEPDLAEQGVCAGAAGPSTITDKNLG
jgi:hypothetical protein